jgi:hypothetical protein
MFAAPAARFFVAGEIDQSTTATESATTDAAIELPTATLRLADTDVATSQAYLDTASDTLVANTSARGQRNDQGDGLPDEVRAEASLLACARRYCTTHVTNCILLTVQGHIDRRAEASLARVERSPSTQEFRYTVSDSQAHATTAPKFARQHSFVGLRADSAPKAMVGQQCR